MISPPFGTHERESFFGEFGSVRAASAEVDKKSLNVFPGKLIARLKTRVAFIS